MAREITEIVDFNRDLNIDEISRSYRDTCSQKCGEILVSNSEISQTFHIFSGNEKIELDEAFGQKDYY